MEKENTPKKESEGTDMTPEQLENYRRNIEWQRECQERDEYARGIGPLGW